MKGHTITAFLFCIAVFVLSFYLGGNLQMYFNLPALLAVSSGTVAAVLLSYPFSRLRSAFFVARNAYFGSLPSADQIIQILLDLSVRSKYHGVLSLEKNENLPITSFLKGALVLLVDGYSELEIKDILSAEVYFYKERRTLNERVFRTMARFAPAFGLIGSIIGLVGMLGGMGDTSIILKTIPIALMATLYGIMLANFVFMPIAENIHTKTQEEMLLQKLIIHGVLAIKMEQNPHKLEAKLVSFLTPASRQATKKSFEDIRKKYLKMRGEKQTPPAPPEKTANPAASR